MSPPAAERVHFVPEEARRAQAAVAFETHRQRLGALLPNAEIHHVGSTAVPGSWTKGDLDIQVRVRPDELARADAVLARHYARNEASDRTRTFSSFKDDGSSPALGIQLTAMGGAEDHFCFLRDYLNAHPEANAHYNALKRRFEGAPMQEYRAAKAIFLAGLIEKKQPLLVKVRDMLSLIQADGWYLDRTRGSHRQFKHPTKPGLVTVPGKPSDDLAPGTLGSILGQAQLPKP